MIDGFTILAFGFCAAIADLPSDNVRLGYVSDGKCIVQMEVGDTGPDHFTIQQHDFKIELLDGGAEVSIDDLKFVLPRLFRA